MLFSITSLEGIHTAKEVLRRRALSRDLSEFAARASTARAPRGCARCDAPRPRPSGCNELSHPDRRARGPATKAATATPRSKAPPATTPDRRGEATAIAWRARYGTA